MIPALQIWYAFGPMKFYPGEHLLIRAARKRDATVDIEPKAAHLLHYLIENRHRVVSQEEILALVWKDTFVTKSSVTVTVTQLRKALRDSPMNPKFIKTIPKKGYRFVAHVSVSKPTLAVLPFRYIGRLKDKDQLEVGIAAALITRLSNVLQQITVRPVEAIFRYAYVDRHPIDVGHEQGADLVLSGSLRREGETIRASIQLTNVGTTETIWAETVEVQASRKFAIEDAITQRVVSSLPVFVSDKERRLLLRRHTENKLAYRHYLEGRYFWHKSTPDAVLKSIASFKRAIKHDPEYVLAYSGLAVAFVLLGTFAHQALAAHDAMEQAEDAARRALDLDSDLPEALSALASVNALFRWNWAAAERDFKQAVVNAPELSALRYWYGLCLAGRGEALEARRQLEQAVRIDPTSALAHTLLARVHYLSRDYEAAIAECKKAIDFEYYFYLSHTFLGQSYRAQGNPLEAIEEFKLARRFSNNAPAVLSEIGFTYGMLNQRSDALKTLQIIGKNSNEQYVSSYVYAHVYLGLKDHNKFFQRLEESYEERSAFLIFLSVDPIYDPVRKDPRFTQLIRRVGYIDQK